MEQYTKKCQNLRNYVNCQMNSILSDCSFSQKCKIFALTIKIKTLQKVTIVR